ncbi:MAG: VOC family protein [Streptosporangiales bacterium]|nr:VOC family protein [Streptosporangiales bacterium]
MRIYRIDHVAQVTPDLEKQVGLLEKLFGFRRTVSWENSEQGVRGVRLAVPGSWGQAWEVLAPSGPTGSWVQAALDANGGRGGFHHVAAEVPDLDVARKEIEGRGIEVTSGTGGDWIQAVLTPPAAGGGVPFRLRGPGSLTLCGDETATVAASQPQGGPDLGIVLLDHVCQAYPDREELARWYSDLAGFTEVWRTPIDLIPDMADLVLNIPGSATCWEIIMPRGEDSFIDRFLAKNGPSVHHVTFQVADWDAALAACDHHEIPTFDEETGVKDGAAWKHRFIHPKHTGGVLVQIFWEEKPGVWVRSDKIAPPAA